MFCADVFVLQFVGFLCGDSHNPVQAGGDEHLDCGPCIGSMAGFGRSLQDGLHLAGDDVHRRADVLQDLADCPIRLLQQGQEYVLGIDLCVLVFVEDLQGAHGCFLGLLRKTVE